MLEHGCIGKEEKVGVRGVKNGIPVDMLDPKYHIHYSENTTKCPNVNMLHEEISSIDGFYMLRLPERGARKDHTLTLLTTIRDPIERIGSQAFYGKYSVARTVIDCSY